MMTLSAYDNKVFDALGNVKKVSEFVDEKQINGVGKIIIDHGYEKSVMVSLAHRHFDLSDNEVMLETHYGDMRVAKPVDIEMLSLYGAEPVLLACTNDEAWHPVGYGVEDISPAWADKGFLKDVSEYLTKNNLHDKLLLVTRNVQDEKKKDGFQYLETNYGETRRSEIQLVKEALLKDAVKTTFGFTCGPNGDVELYCNDWCGCKDC